MVIYIIYFSVKDDTPKPKPITISLQTQIKQEPTEQPIQNEAKPLKSTPPKQIVKQHTTSPQNKDSTNNDTKLYTPDDIALIPKSVIYHYGDEFFELSANQQEYIIDNFQRIRKINEIVGTKILREEFGDIDPDDNNLVEFTIYPDGSIDNLHLEKSRVLTDLDKLTLKTIRQAQPKYPKPKEATKIKIRVYIVIK